MFFGASVIIVGTIIQATSTNLAAFMIGRFMLGVGAALRPSAALPYVSGMAHPAFRGSMTGVYTTFYWIGAIPGTFGEILRQFPGPRADCYQFLMVRVMFKVQWLGVSRFGVN